MTSATLRLQEYFNELMNFADTAVTNQEEQILLAGSMMAVAKMLYHNNLNEQEFDNIHGPQRKRLAKSVTPPNQLYINYYGREKISRFKW